MGEAVNDTEDTRELLGSGGYDLVVLQDQSQTPGYDVSDVSDAELDAALAAAKGSDSPLASGPLNRAESLRLLREFYAPAVARMGARAVFYSSWGRQHGDAANPQRYASPYTIRPSLVISGFVLTDCL